MNMASLSPTWDPPALWSRLDISSSYHRIYTDSKPRDRLSNVQLYLANVRSAAENTAGLVHMRSTCKLPTRVWTLSLYPLYNNNIQIGELLNSDSDMREPQDSDYKGDPGPAGLEPDTFCPDIGYESDAEVFDTTSACVMKQNHFKGAGEVIGDTAGFDDEHSNLYADPWAPFNSVEGFKLASWLIDGKVCKSQINDYFASGLGNAA